MMSTSSTSKMGASCAELCVARHASIFTRTPNALVCNELSCRMLRHHWNETDYCGWPNDFKHDPSTAPWIRASAVPEPLTAMTGNAHSHLMEVFGRMAPYSASASLRTLPTIIITLHPESPELRNLTALLKVHRLQPGNSNSLVKPIFEFTSLYHVAISCTYSFSPVLSPLLFGEKQRHKINNYKLNRLSRTSRGMLKKIASKEKNCARFYMPCAITQ
jgi:hypothetical protein